MQVTKILKKIYKLQAKQVAFCQEIVKILLLLKQIKMKYVKNKNLIIQNQQDIIGIRKEVQ